MFAGDPLLGEAPVSHAINLPQRRLVRTTTGTPPLSVHPRVGECHTVVESAWDNYAPTTVWSDHSVGPTHPLSHPTQWWRHRHG